MTTWRRGREIVAANRAAAGGIAAASSSRTSTSAGCRACPGTAVFPHPGKDTTPLALRANVEHNHVLHEDVLIVSASAANVPHVPADERFTVDDLGYEDDGIQHLSVRFGFSDAPDLPAALRAGVRRRASSSPARSTSTNASYFLSRGSIRRTRGARAWRRWRKVLFLGARAQRRRPGRLLRPARGPHRDDGQRREVLTGPTRMAG